MEVVTVSNGDRPTAEGPCPRCDRGVLFVRVYRANADPELKCDTCSHVVPADVPTRCKGGRA